VGGNEFWSVLEGDLATLLDDIGANDRAAKLGRLIGQQATGAPLSLPGDEYDP